ncbi:hypothetical protein BpHYR1_034691 [Brachionus plicatilis]|uniref:Uncharacterized protein n=1 Tax=Brachionus plicatilis TaxID=10195 RepID=A0A3M7SH65_BRAPC|nr:hypothetical protein BpHYR1_034691 [Brachionus plicatilis]
MTLPKLEFVCLVLTTSQYITKPINVEYKPCKQRIEGSKPAEGGKIFKISLQYGTNGNRFLLGNNSGVDDQLAQKVVENEMSAFSISTRIERDILLKSTI